MFLVKLAKFVGPKEKSFIFKVLREVGLKVKNDSWGTKMSFEVEGDWAGRALEVPGVARLINVSSVFSISSLKELVEAIVREVDGETFRLDLSLWKGVPFHKKALEERLVKKVSLSDSAAKVVYVEAKPLSKTQTAIRMGSYLEPVVARNYSRFALVLEAPISKGEVVDFLRLGTAFRIPLHVVVGKKSRNAIDGAKKIFKSFKSGKVILKEFKSVEKAVEGFEPVAFTMWPTKNELSLDAVLNDPDKKIALIFGNEKEGLSFSTRRLVWKQFKLPTLSSEPLTASQAAAFVLGSI